MSAVLIPTASEAEWLAARRNGVTASEIAVIMGLSPWDSPYALYHRKRGDLPEQERDVAMGLGTYMESYIADRFAELHPGLYAAGDGKMLYAHRDRPWQMATPDRLLHDHECPGDGCTEVTDWLRPDALLECKIDGGSDAWGDDGTDQIPVYYRCQVLWQMDVLGVETAYVACLLWNRRQVRVYEITRDAAAIADLFLMTEEARSFLECVKRGIEPDVDWRPATGAALKHLHPDLEDRDVVIPSTLGRRYRSACAALRKAETRRDLALNQIRARLGSGRRAVLGDGEVVARRDVYDLAEKQITRKAGHVDRIVPVSPKEPK